MSLIHDTELDLTGEAAFVAAVSPHWPLMARFARRLGADEWQDVLQDALATAWRRRDSYDPGRGAPLTWLLGLVADQSRKHRRRVSRTRVRLIDYAPDAAADSPLPDVDLHNAIGRLSDRQRLAVVLHYFCDLTVADTAAVMQCSTGTVKSTLSDARRRLRTTLKGTRDDYRG